MGKANMKKTVPESTGCSVWVMNRLMKITIAQKTRHRTPKELNAF